MSGRPDRHIHDFQSQSVIFFKWMYREKVCIWNFTSSFRFFQISLKVSSKVSCKTWKCLFIKVFSNAIKKVISVRGDGSIQKSARHHARGALGENCIKGLAMRHSIITSFRSQTGLQIVASGSKLKLRRYLHWVAKRIRKFTRKYTQV